MTVYVREAFRRLRSSPTFAAFTVIALAIGLSVVTAVEFILRPVTRPPVGLKNIEALVDIQPAFRGSLPRVSLSYGEYASVRDGQRALQDVLAWSPIQAPIAAEGATDTVFAELVSGTYFPVLQPTLVSGRHITVGDDNPSAPPVVVVSEEFRDRIFGAEAEVLGRSIDIAGRTYQIVGVTSRSFDGFAARGLVTTSVWIPLETGRMLPEYQERFSPESGSHFILMKGRLGLTQTAASVQPAFSALAAELRDEEQPLRLGARHHELSVRPTIDGSLDDITAGIAGPLVIAVSTMTALFFVLVTTNVSNLMVARVVQRRPDYAIRRALGASAFRLTGALVVEVALLMSAAVLVAMPITQFVLTTVESEVMILGRSRLNIASGMSIQVFVTAALLGAVGVLAASVLPILQAIRTPPKESMSNEGGVARAGRWRGKRWLVAAQVFISVALVCATSVWQRRVDSLSSMELGFDFRSLAVALMDFRSQGRLEDDGLMFVTKAIERLGQRPGIQVAAVSGLPVGFGDFGAVSRAGQPPLPAKIVAVSDNAISILGVRIQSGRAIGSLDRPGSPVAAVISEATASKLGLSHPLHESVTVRLPQGRTTRILTAEIVGTTSDTDVASPGAREQGMIYLALSQVASPQIALLVRASSPGVGVEVLREHIAAIDKSLAIKQLAGGEDVVLPSLAFVRTIRAFCSALAGLAMSVAFLGLGTMLLSLVSSRTRELAVRSALGASPLRITWLVVREGLDAVVLGGLPALALVFIATKSLPATLEQVVPPMDFVSVLGVTAAIVTATAVASSVPAIRACRVDPNVALRQL